MPRQYVARDFTSPSSLDAHKIGVSMRSASAQFRILLAPGYAGVFADDAL